MKTQNISSKKRTKRAWGKKRLRQLFTVLTSSNNARVESTSKTLQWKGKASLFCSAILLIIVTVRPASGITPVIMVGHNATDTVAKAEKACTFFCQLALKFTGTKEGRTAMYWLLWMAVQKSASAASLIAMPSFGTSSFVIAFFCGAVYSIETIVGPDNFIGKEFVNYANKWCTKGFIATGVTSILPLQYIKKENAIAFAMKILESMK